MLNIELTISIFRIDHTNIPNGEIYEIRREIATMFHHTNFGSILETKNDKFFNESIEPRTDDYLTPENVLLQIYTLNYPVINGDFSLLVGQSIPNFIQNLHDLNYDCSIRISYFY